MQQQTRPGPHAQPTRTRTPRGKAIALPGPAPRIDWFKLYKAGGLSVAQGDAATMALDVIHGGREMWAAGLPDSVLALQIRATWRQLDPGPLPAESLGAVRDAGDTLLTVVRCMTTDPAVRDYWTDILLAGIRRTSQQAAAERLRRDAARDAGRDAGREDSP